jgi:chromate transport protein ChrA
MLLPGLEAQQLAILSGLSWVCLRFGRQPLVAGVLLGLTPPVTARVLHEA